MILRGADKSDIPAMLPMIRLFCEEINCPYDAESVKQTLLNCLEQGWHLTVVSEANEYIGMCMAIYVPNIADFGKMQVSEAMWHTDPNLSSFTRAKAMILMLCGMEEYAREKGTRLVVSTTIGVSGSLDKHLECAGYAMKEKVYSKEFGHGN